MMKKNKLTELINLLDKAVIIASKFEGGYSDHFLSAQEFHSALRESINQLKNGHFEEIEKLYLWFSPSYDWDDFISDDDHKIAYEIFPILSALINEKN